MRDETSIRLHVNNVTTMCVHTVCKGERVFPVLFRMKLKCGRNSIFMCVRVCVCVCVFVNCLQILSKKLMLSEICAHTFSSLSRSSQTQEMSLCMSGECLYLHYLGKCAYVCMS